MEYEEIPEFPIQQLINSQSDRMHYDGYEADSLLMDYARGIIPDSWFDVSKRPHRISYLQSVADYVEGCIPEGWKVVRHTEDELHRVSMLLFREVRAPQEKMIPVRTPALYQVDVGLREPDFWDFGEDEEKAKGLDWVLYLHVHQKPVHPEGEDTREFRDGAGILSGLVKIGHAHHEIDYCIRETTDTCIAPPDIGSAGMFDALKTIGWRLASLYKSASQFKGCQIGAEAILRAIYRVPVKLDADDDQFIQLSDGDDGGGSSLFASITDDGSESGSSSDDDDDDILFQLRQEFDKYAEAEYLERWEEERDL